MNKEVRIEHYLLQLDRALVALPVSQRAEIVTEIKSHIYAVLDKDPTQSVEPILGGLGSAAQVAERYLAVKGISRAAPSRGHRWLKGLAIVTVAFFAVIFFSGLATVWYLSPIIKVDRAEGHVTLFGGLIDVNEKIGRIRVGGIEVNDALKEGVRVTGEQNIASKNIKMVKIPFNTAQLEISSSADQVLHWDCKATGNASPKTDTTAGVMTLNLDSLNLAKCTIALPFGIATEFQGVNGNMEIESPRDAMDISLTNGKVKIRPDPAKVYDFEVKVKNGLQDSFPRSGAKGAVKIKVHVVNGLVNKE